MRMHTPAPVSPSASSRTLAEKRKKATSPSSQQATTVQTRFAALAPLEWKDRDVGPLRSERVCKMALSLPLQSKTLMSLLSVLAVAR